MASFKIAALPSIPQADPAAKTITQQELIDLIELRNVQNEIEKCVSAKESDVLTRLLAGASVQPGVHIADAKKNSRRSPAWKDVARELATLHGLDADAFVSQVIAATKPSESFSLEVN
ncbi:MAG: hypothetical protein ACRD8A_07355 [Candidatus Acidiferrales bacterium]